MNSDIRLAVDFPTHPKTIMLLDRLGLEAVWALICLWIFAAKHRPDGVLRGMTPDACRIACGYAGDISELLRVLKTPETRFLDEDTPEGWIVLHDWKKHNPWAFGSQVRSEKASKLARLRWNAPRNAPRNANAMRSGNAQRNAPSPSPSPSPSPRSKTKGAFKKKLEPFSLPPWLDPKAWDGFDEMRKRIKKPLTDHAKELIIKKLDGLMRQGQDPNEILNRSTVGDWTGVYAINDNGEKRNGKQQPKTFEQLRAEHDAEIREESNRVLGICRAGVRQPPRIHEKLTTDTTTENFMGNETGDVLEGETIGLE